MTGDACQDLQNETVTVIETNIDDMNPQLYEYVMEMLFDHGALDVYLTPVIMKKSRPGTLLGVLCSADKKYELMDVIFKETTTIGMRFHDACRVTMKREMGHVRTRYGRVRVKVSSFGNGIQRKTPEYEDCRRLALDAKVPLAEIMKEVSESAIRIKGLSKKGEVVRQLLEAALDRFELLEDLGRQHGSGYLPPAGPGGKDGPASPSTPGVRPPSWSARRSRYSICPFTLRRSYVRPALERLQDPGVHAQQEGLPLGHPRSR